jgi:hypothetical protein
MLVVLVIAHPENRFAERDREPLAAACRQRA